MKFDRRKVIENIIIDLDKEDKDLILIIIESIIFEILFELILDKNIIIDIDYIKFVYEDIFGMLTNLDLEVLSGLYDSNEESV